MTAISEQCGGGDVGRPLVPSTLRGYRTWRLVRRRVPDGLLPLTSVIRRQVMWPAMLTAKCVPADAWALPELADRPGHQAPRTGCNCGIYAWYRPDDTGMVSARVFGAIEARGLVVLGERGFRAERVQVTAVVTRNRRLAKACAAAGVDVYASRRDLLRALPPQDVSGLVGEPEPPADPSPKRSSPAAVDRGALLAIWTRTAAILGAAVVLPAALAILAVIVVEVALVLVLLNRLS